MPIFLGEGCFSLPFPRGEVGIKRSRRGYQRANGHFLGLDRTERHLLMKGNPKDDDEEEDSPKEYDYLVGGCHVLLLCFIFHS